MSWPRSKITQTVIALMLGLIAGAIEFGRFAMKSFDNFYFGPHKAFPYPYADSHSANLAMARNCGIAFVLVFALAFGLQRVCTARIPN